MDIKDIRQEYNVKRCLRDSLPICESELRELEENEAVQKYIRLQNHYKEYSYLQGKSDEEILDSIIERDNQVLNDDVYFCYGKSFLGHPRKVGGFYVEQDTGARGSIRRLQGTRVAMYRHLATPNVIAVIPYWDIDAFEQNNQVIMYQTANPEEEYRSIRRKLYEQEIEKASEIKRLVKEPLNEKRGNIKEH